MQLRDVIVFTEALLTSAYVRFCLSFMPFKKVAGWLGSAFMTEANAGAIDVNNIRQVQAALARCHKYALWPTECYTLALTGKIMLKRRKLGSTLYIGFRKDASGNLDGHAWLTSGNLCVAGNIDLRPYSVHSSFS